MGQFIKEGVRFEVKVTCKWEDEVGKSNVEAFANALEKRSKDALSCFDQLKKIDDAIPINKPSRKPVANNIDQYKV